MHAIFQLLSRFSATATEFDGGFPAEIEFCGARLRIFVHAFDEVKREAALKAVDAIYEKILLNRRASGLVHALDDYLVLLRRSGAEHLLDEELERDWRVCRTLVWNLKLESIDEFLRRTPFAELPSALDQQQTLQTIFADVAINLKPWLRLGASRLEDSRLEEWLHVFEGSAEAQS